MWNAFLSLNKMRRAKKRFHALGWALEPWELEESLTWFCADKPGEQGSWQIYPLKGNVLIYNYRTFRRGVTFSQTITWQSWVTLSNINNAASNTFCCKVLRSCLTRWNMFFFFIIDATLINPGRFEPGLGSGFIILRFQKWNQRHLKISLFLNPTVR